MKISSGYVASVRTQNALRRTTNAISLSLQRLSTGQRANSWKEDADSLAIGQKLDAQSRGLTQAAQNINQSMGLISTAEGAIDTQIEIINKMRELALESSNGTISNAQRSDLNKQMTQLFAEFTRLTDDTEFNGQKLLNGSFSKTKLQISGGPDNNLNAAYLDLPDLNASKTFLKTIYLFCILEKHLTIYLMDPAWHVYLLLQQNN
jgi:flagellin